MSMFCIVCKENENIALEIDNNQTFKENSKMNVKYEGNPGTENELQNLQSGFLDDKDIHLLPDVLKIKTGECKTVNQENKSSNIFDHNSICPTENHKIFKGKSGNFSAKNDEIKISHASHKQSRVTKSKMDKNLDNYEVIRITKNGTSNIIYKSLVCPYTNAFKYQIIKHHLTHKKNKNYNCLDCNFSAKCLFLLKRHRKTHVENHVECPLCKFSTTSVLTLRAHSFAKHKNENSKSIYPASKLRKRSSIPKITFVCNHKSATECTKIKKNCTSSSTNRQAKEISNFKTGKSVKKIRKKYKCVKCGFFTDNVVDLSKHKRTHLKLTGNDKLLVKDLSEGKLEKPESHLSQTILSCNNCSFTTSLKIVLLKHKQSHICPPSGVFKCTECPFSTSNNKFLISHLVTHAYKYFYRCMKCNFSTNNKVTLRSHSYSHKKLREKTYYRLYCKNKITVKLQAKNKKTFKCFSCDYSCSSEYLLNQHSLTHLEYKLFKCVHCDYQTNFKGNYAKHVMIHSSDYRPCGFINETEIKKDVTDGSTNKNSAKVKSPNLADVYTKSFVVLSKCPNLQAEEMKVCRYNENDASGIDNIPSFKKQSQIKNLNIVEKGNNMNHNVSGKNALNCDNVNFIKDRYEAEVGKDATSNTSPKLSQNDLECDDCFSYEIANENREDDQKNEFLDNKKVNLSLDVLERKTEKLFNQNVKHKNKSPNISNGNFISPIENQKKLKKSQNFRYNNDKKVELCQNSHKQIRVTKSPLDKSSIDYEVIRITNNGVSTIIYKSLVCPYTNVCKNQIINHCRTHRKNKNYNCLDCNFTAKCLFLLKRHKKTHVENHFECPLCKFATTSVTTLKAHKRSKHRNRKVFKIASKLRKRSLVYGTFNCNKCSFTARDGESYQKHLKICLRNLTKNMKVKKKRTSNSVSAKQRKIFTGKRTKEICVKTAKSTNLVKAKDMYRNLSNVNMNCLVVLNKCPNLQTEEIKVFGNDNENISSEVDHNIPTFKEESQMDVEYDDNSGTEITTENRLQDLKNEFFDVKEDFNSSLDFEKEERHTRIKYNDNLSCEINTKKWYQDKREFDSLFDLTVKEESYNNQKRDDDDDCSSYEISIENQYHDLKTKFLDDEVDLSLNLLEMETSKHELFNQNVTQDIESPSVFEGNLISPIKDPKNIKVESQDLSYYKDEINLNHDSCKQDIVNKSTVDENLSYEVIKTINSGTKTIFYKSLECPYITTVKSKIIQHCKTHEKDRNYDCLDGTMVKIKFECGKCSFVTYNFDNLSKHKRTHTKLSFKDPSEDKLEAPEGPSSQTLLACNSCSFKTSLKIVLLKHKQSHVSSPSGVFKCTECSFKAFNNKSLICHLFTHAYKYLYGCRNCNFSTNNKTTLKSHSYSHKKLREKINVRLFRKKNIAVHLHSKNNKTFKCASCDYSCSSEHLLNQHSVTHLENKLFKCAHCNYETNFKGNLTKHVLTHVSEYKPWGS